MKWLTPSTQVPPFRHWAAILHSSRSVQLYHKNNYSKQGKYVLFIIMKSNDHDQPPKQGPWFQHCSSPVCQLNCYYRRVCNIIAFFGDGYRSGWMVTGFIRHFAVYVKRSLVALRTSWNAHLTLQSAYIKQPLSSITNFVTLLQFRCLHLERTNYIKKYFGRVEHGTHKYTYIITFLDHIVVHILNTCNFTEFVTWSPSQFLTT